MSAPLFVIEENPLAYVARQKWRDSACNKICPTCGNTKWAQHKNLSPRCRVCKQNEQSANQPRANATNQQYRLRKNMAASVTLGADPAIIQMYHDRADHLTKTTGHLHMVDHIIPLSKDGLHHEDNLQVLIYWLNLSKGGRIADHIRGEILTSSGWQTR